MKANMLWWVLVLLTSACKLSDNKQAKVQDPIKKHSQAVHVLDDVWMRDPFITLAPNGYYYLSCTRKNAYYPDSLPAMQFFRSKDLMDWEDLGVQWKAKETEWGNMLYERAKTFKKKKTLLAPDVHGVGPMIWAPEIHFINGKWVIVTTSNLQRASLFISKGDKLEGPFEEPFGVDFGHRHDPSIFMDGNTPWLVYRCAEMIQLTDDLRGFVGEPIKAGPSDRKMGHEGCYITKVEDKYVLWGTAWSTDEMRHGTYNLYYCTADKVTGPYGPRKFAGRFLGHGTPFKDKDGQWWSTAFLNGEYIPAEVVAQQGTDANIATTINKQGLTLVPMDIEMENGEVVVKVLDKHYASPGEEEVQQFSLAN
ncbi:family 43 glycosylhydrolase [Limibacter armeniacum]|uniref:family 43 glycosylhydrolase n=1 Tax=Limibacter armeniacum TaxID=466084 RepID=UPI002FE564CF